MANEQEKKTEKTETPEETRARIKEETREEVIKEHYADLEKKAQEDLAAQAKSKDSVEREKIKLQRAPRSNHLIRKGRRHVLINKVKEAVK